MVYNVLSSFLKRQFNLLFERNSLIHTQLKPAEGCSVLGAEDAMRRLCPPAANSLHEASYVLSDHAQCYDES